MRLKPFLVAMTAVAVVSDSMLHPFYPQYFAEVLGVTSPRHVGLYIAACSATVMLAFPLWANLARRISMVRLLVATQIAAGLLSLACASITALVPFWIVSLAMMVCKASYLLIYPYVLSLDEKTEHLGTISQLAFVVYFGNILAALLSGTVFELLDARWLFFVMAIGDAVQTGLCLLLLAIPGLVPCPEAASAGPAPEPGRATPSFVLKLGLLMFVLYFSAYLTEPFFSVYWERIVADDDRLVIGLVFAIPGIAALLALWANSRRGADDRPAHVVILPSILAGIVGLLLQRTGHSAALVAGRFLYGWALFQTMVRLDVLLFERSTPETYAIDFSRINLFQGLGVLTASLSAGALVRTFDVAALFVIAAGGFVLGAVLFVTLLRLPAETPEESLT